ncbi:MAG: SpaH/EbpB family LPXTG-anchored major pilin [Peptoniphilus sp.]|uniref:SpaH/EbpB family LPXTG-anchored major pilin n=1 Tax=Peptoniphilus sp. TaxID=1971214 RepID=UPI00399B11B3
MNKKKIMSLIMALVMLVGVFSPLSAFASNENEPGKIIEVNVHKILMNKDKLASHDVKKKYDPTKEIENITDFFGEGAKQIGGVAFVAIRSDDAKDATLYAKTDASLKASDITDWDTRVANGTAGLTDTTGVLKLKLKSPGTYKIFEVKEKSTYSSGTTDKDRKILAESKAVPVILELPKHAQTSEGVANSIHVYPKNTEDGPKVDKFVKKKDGVKADEKKEQSFDKTEEHTWVIRADIPTGMKDYQVFELNDKLDKALTYVKGQTVNVQVVEPNTDTVVNTVTFEKGTDYTLTEPTGTEGGNLNVVFTAAGIAKLAQVEGKQVKVEFNTTINDNAVMGKNIPNEVELDYGHDPNNKHKKKPDDNPRVYTGGKRFKKVDGETPLEGAEFVIRRGEKEYLVEKDGKYTWKTIENATTETLVKDTELKKITSAKDTGLFEIKGLKYERPDGTKYKLVEIKAPKDYALPTNNLDGVEFTVNDTSYHKTPANVTLGTQAGDADPQNISNTKVEIPQTGGMGTVLFTVVGISLMAGAVIAMKKNREEA